MCPLKLIVPTMCHSILQKTHKNGSPLFSTKNTWVHSFDGSFTEQITPDSKVSLVFHNPALPQQRHTKDSFKAHRLCEYDRLQKPRNVLKMIRKNQTFDNINLWEFVLLRIKCNFHRTYQESPANHFKLNKAPVQVGLILEMQCNFLPVPVQLIQLQHPFSRTFFRQKSLF